MYVCISMHKDVYFYFQLFNLPNRWFLRETVEFIMSILPFKA